MLSDWSDYDKEKEGYPLFAGNDIVTRIKQSILLIKAQSLESDSTQYYSASVDRLCILIDTMMFELRGCSSPPIYFVRFAGFMINLQTTIITRHRPTTTITSNRASTASFQLPLIDLLPITSTTTLTASFQLPIITSRKKKEEKTNNHIHFHLAKNVQPSIDCLRSPETPNSSRTVHAYFMAFAIGTEYTREAGKGATTPKCVDG